MYLEKINSPADVKKLSSDEMKKLAEEMRTALIKKLSVHGGHCGPNLGMVEAVIALHYVFDSPKDKLVFDVSHRHTATKCSQAEITRSLTNPGTTTLPDTPASMRASTIISRWVTHPLP